MKRLTELKDMLNSDEWAVTPDFVETKSIVTCAYIILKEILERKDEK